MGIDDKLSVMDNANSARIAVILINTWIGIPYTMLITTGILMNIPADLYESAQIDGAKPARVYFKITLPYIFFVTGPYLITQFVGNINNFNVIYFLTGGKPLSVDYLMAGKTDLLVTWLYNLTVNNSQYSKASVIGIMIFIVSAFFSLIAYRNSSAMKNEEDFA
jgi:arabinogalactan oligomer/maltooligosaccharide transport system permease protein